MSNSKCNVHLYIKKPVEVQAIRYHTGTRKEILDWCKKIQHKSIDDDGCEYELENLRIPTLEGEMLLRVGDYLIKGTHGEFYPCKREIFEENYERV